MSNGWSYVLFRIALLVVLLPVGLFLSKVVKVDAPQLQIALVVAGLAVVAVWEIFERRRKRAPRRHENDHDTTS